MHDHRPTRRSVIGAGAALALAAPARAAEPPRPFPKGFIWGTATAAHQVEGGNTNSDWWLLEHLPGTPIREPSGTACDHYRRFRADIARIAYLGFGSYRLSVEWARIEPEPGRYDKAALDHYREVLAECRKRRLKTVVTLHHFTSPRWLAEQGGFENPATVAKFAAYAGEVVRHCGDLIDTICTINEANLSFSSFVPAEALRTLNEGAARVTGKPGWRSYLFDNPEVSKPIVRQCHTAARRTVKALRPTMPVGLTLAMADVQDAPGAPGAGVAKRSAMYDEWLHLARADDFVGVQNYTRERFDATGAVPPPAGVPLTQLGQEYYPQGLAGAVRYAAEVARVPILVTENGIGIEDDTVRVRYLHEALTSLQRCIADGVDVRGYWHWSAMDNFEWLFGYGPKFGLMAVDRATQARTIKPSALRLREIAQTNAV